MPYLVDGDNLLGTWPDRRRSDGERRRLSFELERFARATGREVVVVFDGMAAPGHTPSPAVRYAGRERSADELILEQLRRASDPRGWLVITSDRSLGDRCRWIGARVERSDLFRRRLSRVRTSEKPEREEDLERWLALFGEAEGDDVSGG